MLETLEAESLLPNTSLSILVMSLFVRPCVYNLKANSESCSSYSLTASKNTGLNRDKRSRGIFEKSNGLLLLESVEKPHRF